MNTFVGTLLLHVLESCIDIDEINRNARAGTWTILKIFIQISPNFGVKHPWIK